MAPGPVQVRGPSSRSKAACQNCRNRHAKCDQARPCSACRSLSLTCDYGTSVLFNALEWRPKETFDDSSLRVVPTCSPALSYIFMDETPSLADHYNVLEPSSCELPGVPPAERSPLHSTSRPRSRYLDINNLLDAETPHSALGGTRDESPEPPATLPLRRSSQQSTRRNSRSVTPLTEPTEAFFFGRYADIIGPWFDLFDGSDRYFSVEVPQLALSNRLLLLACIAASSRQHALVTSHGRSDSLSYYNQAIRLLYERLGEQSEPDPETFASCLLIAHCEMVESQAGDWNLHLRGARQLVAIQGWNGISGGLGQACFWIFCRMIILSCLSSSTATPIPTSSWVPPSPTLLTATDSHGWTLPAWANKTVHLLGQVQNFLVSSRSTLEEDATPATLAALRSGWDSLRARMERHDAESPSICRPLSVLPASPSEDVPFPSIRYVNGSVAAARQMFHTTVLLLHLSIPSATSDKARALSQPSVSEPALEAARKIVANSITNRNTIAWVNAVQLLSTAGVCLTEWRERKACARVLEDIQRETGWITEGNTADLMRIWGWEGIQGGWKAVNGNVKMENISELLYRAWEGRVANTYKEY